MTSMAQTMLNSFEKQADSIGKKNCIENWSEETDNQELFYLKQKNNMNGWNRSPQNSSVSISKLKILQP